MQTGFWRKYRNKIFAVAFSGLATFGFLARFIMAGVVSGWASVFTGPVAIINAIITLFVFGTILVTNIFNDDRAYNGISFFVFLMAWRLIWSFLPTGLNLGALFSGSPLGTTLAVLDAVFAAASAGLGIVLYVFIFRYRLGRGDFKKVRLFAILFACALAGLSAVEICVDLLLATSITPTFVVMALLFDLPEALMGVAVAFTLERLRRI